MYLKNYWMNDGVMNSWQDVFLLEIFNQNTYFEFSYIKYHKFLKMISYHYN